MLAQKLIDILYKYKKINISKKEVENTNAEAKH